MKRLNRCIEGPCQYSRRHSARHIRKLSPAGQTTLGYYADKHASDKNQCTRDDSCRSIQRALDTRLLKHAGEMVILDSGDFQPFIISNALVPPTVTSVTVETAPGVYAGITATSDNAITIQSGAADTVVLRGLTLKWMGTTNSAGHQGIDFQAGRTLHVESCVVNGFPFAGILVGRDIANDTAELFVNDTVLRGNLDGIFLSSTGGNSQIKASLDNCRLERNARLDNGPRGAGLVVADNARATVRHTVATNNDDAVASFTFNAGNASEINLENCVVANNFVGLSVGSIGSSLIRVSNSAITDNQFGVSVGPNGSILSRGNNTLEGNGSSNSFPGAYSAK
jgi:hypothetical protein